MTDNAPDSGNSSSEDHSPSRYMRERRPYLFSNSEKTTEVALTREVLSHHLDTLTNQKAEYVFEGFAIRLAEKFIAPNLRPQTGPTGGGDGETNFETYPCLRKSLSDGSPPTFWRPASGGHSHSARSRTGAARSART